MPSNAQFAEIAALSGDPSRASMLHALMDGRALTATELAKAAGISPQTASGHLAQLTAAGLLQVVKQGRHRYHHLASPAVARMIESIMQVAAELAPERRTFTVGPKELALRKARTCYDHFAGELGVALTDALVTRGFVELTSDAGVLTRAGARFLQAQGLDIEEIAARAKARGGRVLCRPCLDWSERRPHLAGVLGASLCTHSLARGWAQRMPGTRAIRITPAGRKVFRDTFGVTLS